MVNSTHHVIESIINQEVTSSNLLNCNNITNLALNIYKNSHICNLET